MKRLIHLLWLILAAPVLAAPEITVLLPVPGALSPQSASEVFGDSQSVRAAQPGLPIATIADSLYASDVALIVLDATQGTLPANRDHVLTTRQASVPHIFVLITNVDELFAAVGDIEGRDYLALWEEEIRAVMEGYGVGGAETPVYHDSSVAGRATPGMIGGLSRLATDLSHVDASDRQDASIRPVHTAEGQVYLLTHEETMDHGATIDGSGDFTLWISGRSVPATIFVDGVASPGDVVNFRYRSAEPSLAADAARMMLIDKNRIVGIGVITAL